jgi:hypothetical protein
MPQLDQDYVFLPQRLLADLQANPAAIGVYALIAPVPDLSGTHPALGGRSAAL